MYLQKTKTTSLKASTATCEPLPWLPSELDKDKKYRLGIFARWLRVTDGNWYAPDLAVYRDYLLRDYQGRFGKPLDPTTVQAHLGTIRGYYTNLLRNNHIRDMLYALTPHDAGPADRKALVDELLQRLTNAVDASAAPLTIITHQDIPDTENLRLTVEQVEQLLHAPGLSTLIGLRDTALIALMLCTGIREAELCALDVIDLRQHYGTALALHIRAGKGAKARLVPYGGLDFCLVICEAWLQAANISSGAIFRGVYKGGKRVRHTRLTGRAVHQIMSDYPVMINGALRLVHPHDLRRTYARSLYEAGVPILAIQQNLGHADHKTTEHYIGRLDARARKPPALYAFDLVKLRELMA